MAAVFVVLVAGVGAYFLFFSHAAASYGPITGIASKCLDNYGQQKTNYNKIDLVVL